MTNISRMKSLLVWRHHRSDSLTRMDHLHPKFLLTDRPNLSDFSSEDGQWIVLFIEIEFVREERYSFRKTTSWFNHRHDESKNEVRKNVQ